MSIPLNEYIKTRDLKPVVPSWFRSERYDYCERFESISSTKRSIFSRLTGKKHSK